MKTFDLDIDLRGFLGVNPELGLLKWTLYSGIWSTLGPIIDGIQEDSIDII